MNRKRQMSQQSQMLGRILLNGKQDMQHLFFQQSRYFLSSWNGKILKQYVVGTIKQEKTFVTRYRSLERSTQLQIIFRARFLLFS